MSSVGRKAEIASNVGWQKRIDAVNTWKADIVL
jgi:hypothetical protein